MCLCAAILGLPVVPDVKNIRAVSSPAEVFSAFRSEYKYSYYADNSPCWTSATDFYDKSRLSNDDTLLKYDFADSYRYRYYGKLFYPYFNAAKTTFFIVPKDRTDYDNYKVTDVSYFVDGEYAVKPYNVSVDGSCEVAVYETNKLITDIKINGDSSMLVVDKVVEVWD